MNSNHEKLCPSPEWAAHLQADVLPAVTAGVDLGQKMLEIGPGPGAATDWLRHKVDRLIAGTNVVVRVGDATRLPDPDESFDSVGTFTMLHHIPTVALQNKLLAQAFRVLRPGGTLVCSDSLASNDLHHFHEGDTYNPVEPSSLLGRLQTIGFGRITIMVDGVLSFTARKPLPDPD
jgi:SAM-dependent methyltransferase